MNITLRVLPILAFLASASCARRTAELADYVSDDGLLKERLVIKDVHGGVVGFTGRE